MKQASNDAPDADNPRISIGRSARLDLYATPEQKRNYMRAAAASNMSLSQWIRGWLDYGSASVRGDR